jgi:hypothetical protein
VPLKGSDHGLDWPLLNVDDLSMLFDHGDHCVRALELAHSIPLPDDEPEYNVAHQAHCATLVKAMVVHLAAQSEYRYNE